MLMRLCMGQNLRAMMAREALPPSLLKVAELYEKHFKDETRGTRANDVLAFDTSYALVDEPTPRPQDLSLLSTEVHALLLSLVSRDGYNGSLSPRAWQRVKIDRLGQEFCTAEDAPRNSRIAFVPGVVDPKWSSASEWFAGVIQGIFTHTRDASDGKHHVTETFFVVSQMVELSSADAEHDYWRRYPECGGRLFYDRLHPGVVLVRNSQVMCHLGTKRCTLPTTDTECMYALPMDR